jgi:hypothetical protein
MVNNSTNIKKKTITSNIYLVKTKMMQHMMLEILLLAMAWDRHKYEVSLNGFLTFYVKHFIDLD